MIVVVILKDVVGRGLVSPPSRSRNILVNPLLKGTILHRISISITLASGGSKPPPYNRIDTACCAKQSVWLSWPLKRP